MMGLEVNHLREVGILGFPAAVVLPQPPQPAAGGKDAGKNEAAKKDVGKNEPATKAAPSDAGKKKEKGGKAAAAPAPAPAPTGPPPAEKTKAELAKMSKEERTAYHAARRAHEVAEKAANETAPELTKAQKRAAERAVQEAKRKEKEDKVNAAKEGDDLLSELKLQGLSEEQARSVAAALKSGEVIAEQDEEEEDEADDLYGSVKAWMREQPEGNVSTESMRDFNMKVRFQGHVDTTPPDHLETILKILVEEACQVCDLAAPKFQPGQAAKALGPLLERWANLIRGLYSKITDVLEATEVVVGAIRAGVESNQAPEQGQNCAVVGYLMAVRELDDFVEDEDLLVGCKTIEPRSHVLQKFIEFLEDAVEEDDDEDDDE